MAENASPPGAFWWLGPESRIGSYVIEEQVGSGEHAAVFRARDERLGRRAAVKVLSPLLTGDSGFRARFMDGYAAVAALDEPHIVPVYGVGEDAGILYVATRFIPGGHLDRWVKSCGRDLPAGRVASVITQVAAALDAVHTANLVHGGVKPGNILVDNAEGRPERAYLSDLGLNRPALSRLLTHAGALRDAADFSAADQAGGKQLWSERADQYALARVAEDLLVRVMPHLNGNSPASRSTSLRDPVSVAPPLDLELPDLVGQVLRKGMAKDPDSRYLSCRDFAAALRDAIESTALPTDDPRHDGQTGSSARAQVTSGPAAEVGPGRVRLQGIQVGRFNRQVNSFLQQAEKIENRARKIIARQTGASSREAATAVDRQTAPRRGRVVVAVSILAAFAVGAGAAFLTFSGTKDDPNSGFAPARPAGLTTTARSDSSVTISWSAPASAPHPTLYLIEQNGMLAGSVPGTVTTYRAVGLAPATTYAYRVVAFQGARQSRPSTVLVTKTQTPPPWQAALTGEWTVLYRAVHVRNIRRTTKLRSDTWTFVPQCTATQCPVTVTGAFGKWSFTRTLRMSGHVHAGSSPESDYLYCRHPQNLMPGTLTIKITGLSGKETGRRWIASAWSGSITISTPAHSGCSAGNITATVHSSR